MTEGIRWKQRFSNYLKALRQLETAKQLSEERDLSELEQQGAIKSFEFTHELAWNLLKDYLGAQGYTKLLGSKDSTRQAFQSGLITNGEVWMDMIEKRNLTSHTYKKELAEELQGLIMESFFPAFKDLERTFTEYYEQEG